MLTDRMAATPAYYVNTNGDVIVVYNYQGGAVPDVKILDVKRSSLREQFDDLYRVLNPEAASGHARHSRGARLLIVIGVTLAEDHGLSHDCQGIGCSERDLHWRGPYGQ